MEIILLNLFITLGIETIFYISLNKRSYKLLIVVTLMNSILNVSMNVALQFCLSSPILYYSLLASFEVVTIAIETLIIYLIFKYRFIKVLLISLMANLSSFVVGFLLGYLKLNQTTFIILISAFGFLYLCVAAFVVTLFIKEKLSNR